MFGAICASFLETPACLTGAYVYARLVGIRRPVVWGQPFLMMVEPTNCNLKCPLCPSGNGQMRRPRGNMSIDDFKQLVDQVADRAS